MALWCSSPIVLAILASIFVTGIVQAERNRFDALMTLLQEPERAQLIEAMLRNHQAKLMRPSNKRVNTMGPSVWVGSSPPQFADDQDSFLVPNTTETRKADEPQKRNGHHSNHRGVRSRNGPLSEETCRTNRYWKQINETTDFYGHPVRVVHAQGLIQTAFVYECVNEGKSCSGISSDLQSTCEMRSGWAYMLSVNLTGPDSNVLPKWGYVSVPHHCACRIYSRPIPFTL